MVFLYMLLAMTAMTDDLAAAIAPLQLRAFQLASRHDWDLVSAFMPFVGRIGYLHAEVSEILEAKRNGEPPSVKIEGFTNLEEECADVFIWLLIEATNSNIRLAQAVQAKLKWFEQHGSAKPGSPCLT